MNSSSRPGIRADATPLAQLYAAPKDFCRNVVNFSLGFVWIAGCPINLLTCSFCPQKLDGNVVNALILLPPQRRVAQSVQLSFIKGRLNTGRRLHFFSLSIVPRQRPGGSGISITIRVHGPNGAQYVRLYPKLSRPVAKRERGISYSAFSAPSLKRAAP